MTEIIINYPSKSALVQLATALGYYDPATKKITEAGQIASGGSAFFNAGPDHKGFTVEATPAVYDNSTMPPTVVTPAVMAPGFWARLRHNGDPASLGAKLTPQVLAQAATLGVTIYKQMSIAGVMTWTADGVNAAPGYVQNVAVIA